MLTYYAELIGLCHETVAETQSLKMLDPMGKKTTATSLFIRVCQRMDKSIDAKEIADKLENVTKRTEAAISTTDSSLASITLLLTTLSR
jgi:hypothetical protein